MFCAQCGVPNLDDVTICSCCGATLRKANLRTVRPVLHGLIGERGFKRLIGQNETIRRLKAFADLYASQHRPIGHIVLIGPDGSGKQTIASAIAQEYGTHLCEIEAGKIETPEDVVAALNSAEGGIVVLSGLNRVRRRTIEGLASCLKDFRMTLNPITAHIQPFTCVATVRKETDCPRDLLHLFPLRIQLEKYSEPELRRLARTLAQERKFSIEHPAAALVAKAAAGNPGEVEALIRHLALTGKNPIIADSAARMLSILGKRVEFTGEASISSVVDRLSGVEFERMVTDLLRTMGFRAEMTKATGDGGIDIEAVSDAPITGGRYLIQCKRFASNSPVGSPVVREFYGALVANQKANKGILITTSGFTTQARQFAENVALELIDGDQLRLLIAKHLPSGG